MQEAVQAPLDGTLNDRVGQSGLHVNTGEEHKEIVVDVSVLVRLSERLALNDGVDSI